MEVETDHWIEIFQITQATVCGREHRRVGKNNQDALAIEKRKQGIGIVVCDGCGSTPFSEFGARWISSYLAKELVTGVGEIDINRRLEVAREEMMVRIKRIASELNQDWTRAVWEHFLATVIGVVVEPENTTFFHCGDGAFIINGKMTLLDSADNSPDYPAYQLLSENGPSIDVFQTLPTEELQSLVIATDGIRFLRDDEIDNSFHPWFKNPYALQRWLNTKAKRRNRDELNSPVLADDCTMVALRRV